MIVILVKVALLVFLASVALWSYPAVVLLLLYIKVLFGPFFNMFILLAKKDLYERRKSELDD